MVSSLDFCLHNFGWLIKPPVSFSGLDQSVLSLHDKGLDFAGKKKIALVLHGVACTWAFVLKIHNDLSRSQIYDEIYMVAYDWRNSIEENADLLNKLIARLNPKSVDLHGYSMGGLVSRLASEISNDKLITHLFTYSSPHLGTPLARWGNSMTIWFASKLVSAIGSWQCDGVRDLVPESSIIKKLGEPKPGVNYIFVAGNAGYKFLSGITQPWFYEPNDGIASVDSQLGGKLESVHRIIADDWDHFAVFNGIRPYVLQKEKKKRVLVLRES